MEKENKKEFKKPIIELIDLEENDVISTSGTFGTGTRPGQFGDLTGEDDPFWN